MHIFNFDVNQTITNIDTVNGKDTFSCVMSCYADLKYSDWKLDIEKRITNKEERKELYTKELWKILSDTEKKEVNFLVAKSKENMIVPAFYKLHKYCNDNNIDHIIVLRTFGNDLNTIVPIIENELKIEFSFNNEDCLTNHCAIQDNFDLWNKNRKTGKLWKISEKFDSYFFDDNVYKAIVHPYNIDKDEDINPKILLNNKLFNVNILDAYLDDDYFIKLIFKSNTNLIDNF